MVFTVHSTGLEPDTSVPSRAVPAQAFLRGRLAQGIGAHRSQVSLATRPLPYLGSGVSAPMPPARSAATCVKGSTLGTTRVGLPVFAAASSIRPGSHAWSPPV